MKNVKARKGTTLDELREMLGFVIDKMATKDDLAEVRSELKGDIAELREEMVDVKKNIVKIRSDLMAVHIQVNGIESELRQARQERLSVRVADLEEKVFGKARS